jgi:two-component system, chemotaxis family, chemotaxis protein CheY
MDSALILASLNVLVIDDDKDMRTLLRRTLVRKQVMRVVEAASGEEGWELLWSPETKINFVLCDWNMPGLSGIDLLQKVKSAKPTLPLLMLTGRADVASIKTALHKGIDGYLVKPVRPQELISKICFVASRLAIRPCL